MTRDNSKSRKYRIVRTENEHGTDEIHHHVDGRTRKVTWDQDGRLMHCTRWV